MSLAFGSRSQIHRRVLGWLHLFLAVVSGLVYISSLRLDRLQYWRPSSGIVLVIVASGVMSPFLISGLYANKVVGDRSIPVIFYSLILLFVAAGMVGLNVGWIDVTLKSGDLVYLVLLQGICYVVAAEFILHSD